MELNLKKENLIELIKGFKEWDDENYSISEDVIWYLNKDKKFFEKDKKTQSEIFLYLSEFLFDLRKQQ